MFKGGSSTQCDCEKNQVSKFLVVAEAQETSSSLGGKMPWGNRPSPPPPFSEKQQAQGEGMFLIRPYRNRDQSGRNYRVALTVDLKFQVSLKLVQNKTFFRWYSKRPNSFSSALTQLADVTAVTNRLSPAPAIIKRD